MSLHVEVTKLSQDINMSTGETENFVVLSLPNGGSVRARVNTEAAEAFMDCFVNGTEAQRKPAQGDEWTPPPPLENEMPDFRRSEDQLGNEVFEFGGPTTAPPRQPRPRPSQDSGEIASSSSDEDGVGQV